MSEIELTYGEFMEHIKKDELVALSCGDCDALIVPPKVVCPFCGSDNLNRINLSGEGSVYSYTVIHVPPPKFVNDAPYTVAIVELDEGARITGRILDVDADNIESGMRVKLSHVDLDDDSVMIAFKPV